MHMVCVSCQHIDHAFIDISYFLHCFCMSTIVLNSVAAVSDIQSNYNYNIYIICTNEVKDRCMDDRVYLK